MFNHDLVNRMGEIGLVMGGVDVGYEQYAENVTVLEVRTEQFEACTGNAGHLL
jgi:hypothetical protein